MYYINQQKKQGWTKSGMRLLLFLSGMLALASCDKNSDGPVAIDNNKLSLVIADNFNLSIFSAALNRSGLYKTLRDEEGPFTALAPSDDAFTAAGYRDATSLLTADASLVSRIANYHILDGVYKLNEFPYLFNQEARSHSGGKLFITHWVKGPDTVLTVNGARVLAQNVPASNGYVQVINRVLAPYIHDRLGDALADEDNITIFYQVVKRLGLLDLLNGEGPYTVFAPSNAAMRTYGLASVEAVNEADPASLEAMLRYHIVEDRRFVNDYILTAGPSNQSKQSMLDGNTITVTLIANASAPGGFSGIRLQGTGNTAVVNTVSQDILAGNGVLHIIDGVLRINQ